MEPVAIIILFFGILLSLIVGSVMCDRKASRIIFGIVTLAWSCLMFLAAHAAESYDLNIWYSGAASKLLDESIKAIDSGRHGDVAAAFKQMNESLEATYENRGNFRELANEASSDLARKRAEAEPDAPSGP